MRLPQEDRDLSPYTGWTRSHWEAAADQLLAAAAPYATPDGALYHLPGGRTSWAGTLSDGLEGYARTLLLAAFRRDETALGRYADGLAAGTSGVWPRIEDRGQPLVEAASIALALRLTRPLLWDRLDDGVRERATAWLGDALDVAAWPCNWELFPAVVAGFLGDVPARDRALERIEQWYVGDGWYTDGDGRKFDYYNGWAMHLYPMLEAWLSDDEKLLDLYGGRLRTHLADYQRLFGGDGAPMHQGRSLTYRMASTAPLWLGAMTGHTPLTPGTTRRLASGALRYFLDRGATNEEGLLTQGWHGPYAGVLQQYSGPASPYWASKAFIGLLLPADHEVWTAREEPGPAEREDAVTALPAPNWLLQSTVADGVVRLHNHGSEDPRYDPYYSRLAYSTVTGPTATAAGDNHFGLVGDAADSPREGIEPLGAGDGWAASRHMVGEVGITSVVLARGATEVRVHLVTGAVPGTLVRHTGWPAGADVTSELLPVHGLLAAAAGSGETAYTPGASRASIPTLTGETTRDPAGTLFVALARLTAEPGPRPLADTAAVGIEWRGDGYEVTVTWEDGTTRRVRVGGREVRGEVRGEVRSTDLQ
ncbi:DUF2264 domain-containing protein [Streptomyces sp. NPDC052236]|uniref:DUF2264 domain-containing protein n=1 Tax=Streptomyces sp. NPDC052236 TaxID=3365686 RepID=UPI0037D8E8AC